MDQDAFRGLLASESSSQPRPTVTINEYKRKHKKKEAETASGPAFKPRNHKKPVENYRDRATERRGGANDFADVEKVLEDFERVNANTDAGKIEEQRKMLGGDEKHTVLVKGLDFALLEQQKAKLYESQDAEDEIALEKVYQELSRPKKRTREDLIAELKKSRTEGVPVDKPLEIAKQQGKFRPIGAPADAKPKKRKVKASEKEGEKKKKHKLENPAHDIDGDSEMKDAAGGPNHQPGHVPPPQQKPRPKSVSPVIDPEADIFGEVEEYRGLPSGSESGSDADDGGQSHTKPLERAPPRNSPPPAATAPKDWFGDKKEDEVPVPAPGSRPPPESEPEEGEEAEPVKPMRRLQGLASSSVPSVREILAMDEAAEREEKRKAKKEKRNKKKNPSEETKINREVKQLEQYVAKKDK